MINVDRIWLGRKSKELGFVRDTFEKVFRLSQILSAMRENPLLSSCLALKGGTAINLTIFNLPRLSVDIDLDLAENLPRDGMIIKRGDITEILQKEMDDSGYSLSIKSKKYHALDSFVYEYQNSAGMKDNLKIEINYMLRSHVLPTTRREVILPWDTSNLDVLSVDPVEIFASKIVAMLNRSAPRDIFDVYNMLHFGLFDETEQAMLHKCIVFYCAVGSPSIPAKFSYEAICNIPQFRIKTDLLPVLHHGNFFDIKKAQVEIKDYLETLLILTPSEAEFLSEFREGRYVPELLFTDAEILDRIRSHPMALWKCGKKKLHDLNEIQI